MSALKARPSLQQVVKFWMLTSGYLKHRELLCNFKCAQLFNTNSSCMQLTYRFLFHYSPCSLHLAPEQQRILGRAGFSVVLCLYLDHLDLNKHTEMQHLSYRGRDNEAQTLHLLSLSNFFSGTYCTFTCQVFYVTLTDYHAC